MTVSPLRPRLIMTVLAGVLFLSACSEAPAPAPSTSPSTPAASSAETAVSSEPLLTAAMSTVLDQTVSYPTASPAQVSSSIIALQPGAETGLHRHDAPMYAYILEGVLTVTYDGGTEKTYTAGEAILEAVGTAHNGKNSGTLPVKILVVNIGAEGVANSVPLP